MTEPCLITSTFFKTENTNKERDGWNSFTPSLVTLVTLVYKQLCDGDDVVLSVPFLFLRARNQNAPDQPPSYQMGWSRETTWLTMT
jgi:hypothetical protein